MTSLVTHNSNMGRKHRSRQEIIYSILSFMGQRGTTITKVFYNSMISYEQSREYIDNLIKLGMVTFDERARLYRITAKGEHFLQIYSVIRQQLGEE